MKITVIILSVATGALAVLAVIGGLIVGGLHAQTVRDQAAISALAGKITGEHRDTITCQDWHRMLVPASGTDSAGGTLAVWAEAPDLPGHCVNG